MERLPDRVGDGVWFRGRGGRALSQCRGDFFREQCSMVCEGVEDRWEGSRRWSQDEMIEERIVYLSGD